MVKTTPDCLMHYGGKFNTKDFVLFSYLTNLVILSFESFHFYYAPELQNMGNFFLGATYEILTHHKVRFCQDWLWQEISSADRDSLTKSTADDFSNYLSKMKYMRNSGKV